MSTDHGRKYRSKKSHVFPVWNGIFEHASKIGEAVWTFLWCLDAITHEKDGMGIVHGGAPVKIQRIANDLGFCCRTVRRHLDMLDGSYIARRRTPYGFVIHVLNSKKFGIWSTQKESGHGCRSTSRQK